MNPAALLAVLVARYGEYVEHKNAILHCNRLSKTFSSHAHAISDSQEYCRRLSCDMCDILILAFHHESVRGLCERKSVKVNGETRVAIAETVIEELGPRTLYHIVKGGEKVFTFESAAPDPTLLRIFGVICDILREVPGFGSHLKLYDPKTVRFSA
jgi:hypothetical protein